MWRKMLPWWWWRHTGCHGEKDAPLDPGGMPQCLRISVARLASCAREWLANVDDVQKRYRLRLVSVSLLYHGADAILLPRTVPNLMFNVLVPLPNEYKSLSLH